MLINKICDSVEPDSRKLSDLSDKDLYSRALDLQSILEGELSEEDRAKYEKEDYDLVSEIVRRRRTKDGKVSDSLDDMIAELEAIPWWATDEVTEQVKKIVAQNGTKTIKKDGKEILTFAESQSGTPLYSYKQHAWTPFDKSKVSDSISSKVYFKDGLRDKIRKVLEEKGYAVSDGEDYLLVDGMLSYHDVSDDLNKVGVKFFDYYITPSKEVSDDGVTRMSDIGSNRPGKFGDSFDIASAVKIGIPEDSIDKAIVKLVKAGIRVALQDKTLYAESSREDAEKALEGIQYKIADASDLSKFKVKLRDVEEVRKRFKDAGIPLYWSGKFLYADAPETKVDEILGDIDHTFLSTFSGGDGMMWVKIPDDKQRHDALVKLIVAGLRAYTDGDRIIVSEDRDKVEELLKGIDYQIMDSAQADQMSFSWEEFADKVDSADDATSYSDHVVVSGDKAYRVQITEEVNDALPALAVAALTPIAAKVGEKVAEKLGDSIWGTAKEATRFSSRDAARRVMVYNKLQDSAKVVKSTKGFFKIVDASGKSYKGSKVCDCWVLSKQELLEKRPSWVADSAIWEKAVDRLTGDSGEYANAKSVAMLYKRLGGTRKVKDSFIRDIQVGDTLRIVRGDHVGEFGEVLAVNPDGTFTLKNLVTGEEFTEPDTLFGLKVNVEDSENGPKIEDAMDAPSLKRALSVILETADPQNRKRSVTSKVATFLNYYNLDVEVEPEDNTIWLSDDDTKLKVDEDKIWIMRPGEKPESFGLLDDIESWFARVKELSPVNPQA